MRKGREEGQWTNNPQLICWPFLDVPCLGCPGSGPVLTSRGTQFHWGHQWHQCLGMCSHVCVYAHACVCACAYMCLCMWGACTHACVCSYIQVYVCVLKNVWAYGHLCVCMCVCTCAVLESTGLSVVGQAISHSLFITELKTK